MSNWISVGDKVLNVDNIELVEQINTNCIRVYLISGKIIDLTNIAAVSLWKYLDFERLKFLDLENPTRDFSGI
jgi:hypothetical protein